MARSLPRSCLLLLALCAVLSTGCMHTRSISSTAGTSKGVAAATATFNELGIGPAEKIGENTVVSQWSWCGDRSGGNLIAMFPLTWARYKVVVASDAVVLSGEAWGANGLLLFGILPGALVNLPLPFPMENVEDRLVSKLK